MIDEKEIEQLYKSGLFFILAYYYSKDKKELIFLFIPILIAVYSLGGDRLNMFAYFIFLYYALPINRGINFGIIFTSIYFSYKSIISCYNIVIHGDMFFK